MLIIKVAFSYSGWRFSIFDLKLLGTVFEGILEMSVVVNWYLNNWLDFTCDVDEFIFLVCVFIVHKYV